MCTSSPPKKESKIDQIIERIGNDGPFQRNYNILIVCLSFLMAMQYMTKIITLRVPDHWCHVPGREETNFTIEEWKNLTIPIIYDSIAASSKYSKCTRFVDEHQNATMECDLGWDYDHTWYDMTASSQNNWVCEEKMTPTHALAVNRAADMIGTIVFGQLSDNYGRMPIFYISLIFILIGRIALLFTSSWTYLFLFFSFLGSLPNNTVVLCCYIIAIEISGSTKRTYITMITGYGWCTGLILSPLLMWWQRDWVSYCLISTIPCALLLFTQKWMIESPRWLLSSEKSQRCVDVLKKMAKANKTKLSESTKSLLLTDQDENGSKLYTMLGIFSSFRLAKNILLLVYALSAITAIYLCLFLSAHNLAGNPYLNYVFLGAVDLPVYVISKYGCDYFGRRIVVLFGFLTSCLGSLIMSYLVQYPSMTVYMIVICIFTKGTVAMTIKTMYLLVMEISPTCIRQTSMAVISILSGAFCILGPYIVSLGLTVNIIFPYIVYALLAFFAFIGCIFLPETMGQKLPDTLEDGATFGADQNIWGRTKNQKYQKQPDLYVPLRSYSIISL